MIVGAGGLIVTTFKFWASPARQLTFVPASAGLAIMAVDVGGGILGLVAWLGFGVTLIRV